MISAAAPRLELHPDRLFPADPDRRAIARRLYAQVQSLPILSPHGHTDPSWYANDNAFPDPSTLLIKPDHYIFRMLYSQGIKLEALGIQRRDGSAAETDNRKIWQLFAGNYHLFQATPTRAWCDHVFASLFGLKHRLTAATADHYYDTIAEHLTTPQFRPRALFERFGIEAIATTESPLDPLLSHQKIRASGWGGRVITAYRPDAVVDPEFEGFAANLKKFGEISGCDTSHYAGYLAAHRERRNYFKSFGATSTDHGHPTAATADLTLPEAEKLFARVQGGQADAREAELFRAHMLTVMAEMSLEDGLVLQIHPGSLRNHNARLFRDFGRDMGCDIPTRTDYVRALKPLLDRFGNEAELTVILFTLDETSYSRELAPLAGHYPALKLGPAWWFHDSFEGMKRFRELTTETAGFYNTVGFNDDTRAYLSIPARHDVSRRVDCAYLAELVATHRLEEDEANHLAGELAYGLARRAYKL